MRVRFKGAFGAATTVLKSNGGAAVGKSPVRIVAVAPTFFFKKSHCNFLAAIAWSQLMSQKITFFYLKLVLKVLLEDHTKPLNSEDQLLRKIGSIEFYTT